MSIDWSARVWHSSRQKGSAKLLLLAIARYVGPDGSTTDLTIQDLTHLLGAKERAVQALLQKLEHAGELRRELGAGPHGRNRYTLLGVPDAPVHSSTPPAQPAATTPHDHNDGPGEQACVPIRKEGRIEGGDAHALDDQGGATLSAPITNPLTLWQSIREAVQSLDAQRLQVLVAEQDAATGGCGAYWVARAILAAVATDATFATNPRALNLVRAILTRWQREGSYGSDTPAYQAKQQTVRQHGTPAASDATVRRVPSQPAIDRPIWRSATTARMIAQADMARP